MTFSHLNYSDDYDLDVVVVSSTTTAGRKFIFSQTRHKIEIPIKVMGSMVVETAYKGSLFGTMKSPVNSLQTAYSGKIGITEAIPVNGKSLYSIESVCQANGKMMQPTDIKMLVEGKKDFTKVVSMLEEFIEIKTPNRNQVNC